MRLNDLFTPKPKENSSKYFLGLEINESLIKTALWQVENETSSVVSLGSFEMWDSEETLINGVDSSLTEAVRGLDQKPDEVILGLPNSWLVEGGTKIHQSKKVIINKVIKELGLKPIGMVNIADAIIAYLKVQEGVPPTAILLEIYNLKVVVSLINIGQTVASEDVVRSDDLARDVEEGLARLDVDKLPARFILTDGSNMENEVQQITSYPWTEKLSFLHLPKVQALPIDFSIKAIALAGGTEAAKSLGLEIAQPTPKNDLETVGFSLESDVVEPVFEKTEETEETVEEPISEPELEPKPKLKVSFKLPHFTLPPFPKLPTVKIPRLAYLLFLLIPLILIPLVLTFYQLFVVKYDLLLVMDPKRVSKSIDITVAETQKPDSPTLVAQKKNLSASASESAPTTGEVTVGDKAVGRVTIYNYSLAPLSLKSGTKIYFNNLAYTLGSASVAASSSSTLADNGDRITSPGKVTIDASAGKIGAEYNLDKGVQFSVDNFPKSNVIANSDTPFTGGSSRTVKAVSKSDQDKLLNSVSQKIKQQIEDQLRQDNDDLRILPANDLKFSTKNYSANLNEEATTFSLDLAASQDVLVYSYTGLLQLVQSEALKGEEAGFAPVSSQTSLGIGEMKKNPDGSFTTSVKVDLELIPVFNSGDYAKLLTLKTRSGARSKLENLNNFVDIKYTSKPKIPLFNNLLPALPGNIRISVTTK